MARHNGWLADWLGWWACSIHLLHGRWMKGLLSRSVRQPTHGRWEPHRQNLLPLHSLSLILLSCYGEITVIVRCGWVEQFTTHSFLSFLQGNARRHEKSRAWRNLDSLAAAAAYHGVSRFGRPKPPKIEYYIHEITALGLFNYYYYYYKLTGQYICKDKQVICHLLSYGTILYKYHHTRKNNYTNKYNEPWFRVFLHVIKHYYDFNTKVYFFFKHRGGPLFKKSKH